MVIRSPDKLTPSHPGRAARLLTLLWCLMLPLSVVAQNAQYETRKDVMEAISRFGQLIESTSENAEIYVKRGDAYFLIHDFDLAIKDYTSAIDRDDSLDLAYFGRGLAYGRRRLIDEGIADLDVFIQRNPESSLGYTKRGVRYLWKQDLENASRDLLKAIELDSYNAEAHDDLGVVYSLQNKYADAILQFLQTVAIDPSYQKGFHNLAMSLYVTEKDEWALNAVNESLTLKPDARDSVHLKGLILGALGRNKEAEEYLLDAEFLPEANLSESIAFFSREAGTALELTGLDARVHRFADYLKLDKWIVLNIWGPKCPPCIEEIPQLQAFHDEHFEKDAMVIGLAIDYPGFGYAKIDEVKEFVDLNSVTYTILLGDAATIPRFGAGPLLATPMTIIYAPGGELAGSHVGAVTANQIEDFVNGIRTGTFN
jgi:tetratricopeptide (TPR) repeat protein